MLIAINVGLVGAGVVHFANLRRGTFCFLTSANNFFRVGVVFAVVERCGAALAFRDIGARQLRVIRCLAISLPRPNAIYVCLAIGGVAFAAVPSPLIL